MKIFKEHEAIRLIAQAPNRFIPYLGAGVSAESRVLTADGICQQIRDQLVEGLPEDESKRFEEETLEWSNPAVRYSKCIHSYGNQSHRVQYFRQLLAGKSPSFAHYALAILTREGKLKRTVLTTNFDKLIESAFIHLGTLECQAIRTDEEQEFLDLEPDKTYILKLHGDYDTYNIRNTASELLYIREALEKRVVKLAQASGMLVLGASGFEGSIQRLFGTLSRDMSEDHQTLGYGLLWGIYMGRERQDDVSSESVAKVIQKSVSRKIIETIEEANKNNELCGFFPVWGAGEFLHRLVERTCSPQVAFDVRLYLSHEMRLRRVLNNAGLTEDGIAKHLRKLESAKLRLETAGTGVAVAEHVCSFSGAKTNLKVELLYGDLSSREMLASGEGVTAVVSPEDTTISAGGGVAYALLEGAGPQYMLNELAKHQPIAQNDAIVTSAGQLPVHYVLHAAALRITETGDHLVSPENVRMTVLAVLDRAHALGVNTLFLPLMAAGAADVTPENSLSAIASAIHERLNFRLTIKLVIYRDSILARENAIGILTKGLDIQPEN